MGSSYQKHLTHLYKKAPVKRHSVERDLDALRRLGIYPMESLKALQLPLTKEVEKELLDLLKQHSTHKYTVVHPVSRWMYKSPQSDLFIKVLKQIEGPIFITGSSFGIEKAYIDRLLEDLPHAKYFPTSGRLDLFMALIKHARGLLTVDSLPLHIASCFKTPTVALFGPTSELDWGPWQNPKSYVVVYKKPCRACYIDGCGGGKLADCLELIDPQEVTAACRDVFLKGE
jgi:heptosyltransferase-3